MTTRAVAARTGADAYRDLSLWHEQYPGSWEPRAGLPGDLSVDVAVVGAGYTGLWTAYALAKADPSLRIAVLEREVAGFGASGRNGGWCSALFPTSWARLAKDSGREGAVAMQRALEGTVRAVGADAAAEGIACSYARGGMVSLARGPAQLARAQAHVQQARAFGLGPDTLDLVPGDEARRRVGASRVEGAVTTEHCAALDPARLVRGLAQAVERRGAALYERTPVTRVLPGRVETPHGTVRAEHVLVATEGYTAQLPGRRRELAPVYSLMLATAPLPDEVWAQIGLADRATFSDERHLTIYGQRTADGRLAFGGRGAPYHLGSRVRPEYDRVERVHTRCARRSSTCSRCCATSRSPTPGAATSGSRATGFPRSVWTAAQASRGPAATSATVSPPLTWPATPSPTSYLGTTRLAPRCPGCAPGPGAGSPSRCAGSASTR